MHVSLTDELIVIMGACAGLTKMVSPNVNVCGRNSPDQRVMILSRPGYKIDMTVGMFQITFPVELFVVL